MAPCDLCRISGIPKIRQSCLGTAYPPLIISPTAPPSHLCSHYCLATLAFSLLLEQAKHIWNFGSFFWMCSWREASVPASLGESSLRSQFWSSPLAETFRSHSKQLTPLCLSLSHQTLICLKIKDNRDLTYFPDSVTRGAYHVTLTKYLKDW